MYLGIGDHYILDNGRVQNQGTFFPGRSSLKRAADVHAHRKQKPTSQSLQRLYNPSFPPSEIYHQSQITNLPQTKNSTIPPHLIPQTLNPPHLPRREILIARIRRVIHIIVHRINARLLGTTVLGRLHGTPVRALALRRRIANEIPVAVARVALESVQESQPVARLVDGSPAFAVAADIAARHGAGGDVAAVRDVDGRRGAGGDFGGESAGSQDAAGEV